MKASNPLPSNTATRSLKLRVGEQVKQIKPSGPLKAVIPYQRTSVAPNNNDPSTKVKKYVQTSTPLATNNLSKAVAPAAASTPVVSTDKPSMLSVNRNSQNRLSYTPSTPLAKQVIRQPSSERKKRSVTFCEDSDKLSRSMIIGSSHSKDTTLPSVPPLQRRRFWMKNKSIDQVTNFTSISCDIFLSIYLNLSFCVA